MSKESSEELASIAGRVMQMAQQGGPVAKAIDEIIEGLAKANSREEAIAAVDLVLRPYIDDAERLAGSVMSQAE